MNDAPDREKFHNPELFLSELLKRSARGELLSREESPSFLLRAVVLAVDTVGGRLENESGSGKVEHVVGGEKRSVPAIPGVPNPRNSVKARVLSGGFDQFMVDDRVRVFWPFFPEHFAVPVKPGEHVYVLFEDGDREHGLWVCKVPGQENLNFFRGQDAFKGSPPGALFELFPDTSGGSRGDNALDTDQAAGEGQAQDGKLLELF